MLGTCGCLPLTWILATEQTQQTRVLLAWMEGAAKSVVAAATTATGDDEVADSDDGSFQDSDGESPAVSQEVDGWETVGGTADNIAAGAFLPAVGGGQGTPTTPMTAVGATDTAQEVGQALRSRCRQHHSNQHPQHQLCQRQALGVVWALTLHR